MRDRGGDSIRDTEGQKQRDPNRRWKTERARETDKDRITVRERRQGEGLGERRSWPRAVKGLRGTGSQSVRRTYPRCPTF